MPSQLHHPQTHLPLLPTSLPCNCQMESNHWPPPIILTSPKPHPAHATHTNQPLKNTSLTFAQWCTQHATLTSQTCHTTANCKIINFLSSLPLVLSQHTQSTCLVPEFNRHTIHAAQQLSLIPHVPTLMNTLLNISTNQHYKSKPLHPFASYQSTVHQDVIMYIFVPNHIQYYKWVC